VTISFFNNKQRGEKFVPAGASSKNGQYALLIPVNEKGGKEKREEGGEIASQFHSERLGTVNSFCV